MKVQIINEAMTEEHFDNLSPDIEVLILIDCDSEVKINNLPFGLKYLIFTFDIDLHENRIPAHIKLPFGCESFMTLHKEHFIKNRLGYQLNLKDKNLLKILRGYDEKEISFNDYNVPWGSKFSENHLSHHKKNFKIIQQIKEEYQVFIK